MRLDVLTAADELARVVPGWDELAVALGAPACLPGWQLAWWRTQAPPGAMLRVAVATAGGRVVGVAPFFAVPLRGGRWEHRLLAARVTHDAGPLVAPEWRDAVVPRLGAALAAAGPAPVRLTLEGVDVAADWLTRMRSAWPGERTPWELVERREVAPYVDLRHDGYDAWLAAKSANFRQQARRYRRRLHDAGGAVRATRSLDELERDVDALVRLHHARWDGRGGSSLPRDVGGFLVAAGRELLPSGRMRLWVVERGSRPIGALLFIAAGGRVIYWNGGFDEREAALRPAFVAMLAAIEDAIARGEHTLDLGEGGQGYKRRLADGERMLQWSVLVPRGPRHLLTRAGLGKRWLIGHARRGFDALPPERQEQVRRLARRVGGVTR